GKIARAGGWWPVTVWPLPRACAVAVLPSRPARRPLRAEKCAVVSTIGGCFVPEQCRRKDHQPPMSNDPVGRRPRSVDLHPKLRLTALAALVGGVIRLAAAALLLSHYGIPPT